MSDKREGMIRGKSGIWLDAELQAKAKELEANPELMASLTPRMNSYFKQLPWPKQWAALLLNGQEGLYGGAAGPGKVVDKEGLVLTPFGFKKGKDLKVGDAVNNPDGSVARIIQIHPTVRLPAWWVRFSDGTQTKVAADHLWLAWRSGKRKKVSNGGKFGMAAAEIVETRTIKEWVDEANRQVECGIRPNWPCIPVCSEQPFNVTHRYPSVLDPYVLGLLIGDGSIVDANALTITTADIDFMCAELDRRGLEYSVIGKQEGNHAVSLRFRGESRKLIAAELEKLKLLGTYSDNKFIPRQFLYGSIESRYQLLRGLMDTDGHCCEEDTGYCTISRRLVKDIMFLIQSLGGTATLSEKNPTYTYKGERRNGQKAYTLYIKHPDQTKLFSLPRKLKVASSRASTPMYRRVVGVEVDGEIIGNCITVSHPNGLYLTNDFIVTHNSSYLLMAALQYADVPGYSAVLLRRTWAQLSQPGGLIPRSQEWLDGTGAKWSETKKLWTFPCKDGPPAVLQFLHMEHPTDMYNLKGLEAQFFGWDELTEFEEAMYLYGFSRLRKPRCPIHDSTPNTQDCAFCQRNHKLMAVPLRVRAASNPGGIGHDWVKQRFVEQPNTPDRFFIPGTVYDNQAVDAESYVKSLHHLPMIERKRLLDGDWNVTESGMLFRRDWFKVIDTAPANLACVRAWDLAASAVKKGRDPDYTVGAKLGIDGNGIVVVLDLKIMRDTPLNVEMLVRETAERDGIEVPIYIEQEPGASGKSLMEHYQRNVLRGFVFSFDRNTGSKAARAKPWSAYAEAGHVCMLRRDWNTPFLEQHEMFSGKADGPHDDIVDACSLAFAQLKQPIARRESFYSDDLNDLDAIERELASTWG
jgi:predicted phage terminase large subunit-like protein